MPVKGFRPLMLALMLLCISCRLSAQYVAIPDTSFARYLKVTVFNPCITGNGTTGFRLDTVCAAQISAYMDIQVVNADPAIADLTGLQYLKSIVSLSINDVVPGCVIPGLPNALQRIDCQGIQISNLPRLPDSLIYLNVGFCRFTSLPALPAHLQTLYCSDNNLTSLPALPTSLRTLYCYNNNISTLSALPDSLRTLYCGNNPLISSLPPLPAKLSTLSCGATAIAAIPAIGDSLLVLGADHTLLTSVPTLPAHLTDLSVSYCNLTNLPALPTTIKTLTVGHNHISGLPALPDSLTSLSCGNNNLTRLPVLPSKLTTLYCDSNMLDSLPALPAPLTMLHCASNRLTRLPLFPAGLNQVYLMYNPQLACIPPVGVSQMLYFYINGTAVTCIPNRFTAYNYDRDPSSMNVCVGTCYSTNFTIQIPDSNLGHWLYTHGYSSVMGGNGVTGYFLDTSSALVRNADTIDCSGINLRYPQGLESFTHLRYLNCSHNLIGQGLTVHWPQALTYLNCSYNQLTGLNTLPSGLVHLDCSNNITNYSTGIGQLPNPLPTGLQYFDYSGNSVHNVYSLPSGLTYLNMAFNSVNNYFPDSFPATLQYLNCMAAGFQIMPVMPAGLTYLDCSMGGITNLTRLPDSLKYLDCSSDITMDSIPTLPAGLTYLHCSGNPGSVTLGRLTRLPALPAGMQQLNCSYNRITSLPTLPPGLITLNCDSNQITSLPSLPGSIDTLSCRYNLHLACLPPVGRSAIGQFRINNTQITCLPNTFTAASYDRNPATMSLCTATSGCPYSPFSIRGQVHNDVSATCTADSAVPGAPMQYIKILLKQNNNIVAQCYTDSAGNYSFPVSPQQNYNVSVETGYLPLDVWCPANTSYNVTLPPTDSIAAGRDFGLHCRQLDYGITVLEGDRFKPGDTTLLSVIAGNPLLHIFHGQCGGGMPGTVQVIIDGPVQYAGPAPGALVPTVTGDTLRYSIAELDSLTRGDLYVNIYTDTTAVAGTPVCISGSIVPSTPDLFPDDDTMSRCLLVVSSLDPNHKTGTPSVLSSNSSWITYTIEFQNTGTAAADEVVIRDTLSTLVQPGTFRYIASSHPVKINLTGAAMKFDFQNINLIDSATDPVESKGWLQYKVQTRNGLPSLSQVLNTAYIYFDYNPAIVTNTALSIVGIPTGISIIPSSHIAIYPNPNEGSFILRTEGSKGVAYTITNMLGQNILEGIISSDRENIQLPADVVPGIYALNVQGVLPLRFMLAK